MKRPKILEDITPNFDWDSKKIWKLDLPVQEMNMDDLIWHFDYPFWEKEGTDDWNLTPWELIKNPEAEPSHYTKIQDADLAFPIEVIEYKGRYRILDGIHRLAKAYMQGQKTIQVRIIPEEKFKEIDVRNFTPLVGGRSLSLEMCRQYLGKIVTIKIDQPLGTVYKGITYERNYGFVPNTIAPDGKELDGYYLSASEPLDEATGICIAIIHRLEDDDDKLVLVKDGIEMYDDEIEQAVNFVERMYKHEIVKI